MRAPTQIRFCGHQRCDGDMMLVFSVDDGTGRNYVAAVAVEPFTRELRFPHALCAEGEPINAVIDAALLERAQETIALLDAATSWNTLTRARVRAA